MAKQEIDWEFRAALNYQCKRIMKADEAVYKASCEMGGMSAGSGITPFINDHREAMERLHKLQDELVALCKRGEL